MKGYRYASALLLGFLAVIVTVLPGRAADRIYLRYGLFGVTIPVAALETFVETGTAEPLDAYLPLLKSEQRLQLQKALQATYNLDLEMVSQFTYTASGEQLLQEMGDLFQTASGQNGFYSLRSAAILTAANSEAASLLNFFRHLPTDMQVDLPKLLRLQRQFARLFQQSAQITANIAQKSSEAATSSSHIPDPPATDPVSQLDLRQPGSIPFTQQTLTWTDESRDRTLTFDLYLPEVSPNVSSGVSTPAPVIVVSNGLGARRDRFTELASHLASHGFAVVIPDHPGSDRERLRDFYRGLYRENFAAAEFIDRPLDITFLLDQLEHFNQTELNNLLNLNQVGVFGYSFGGTTALSLAGAEMQFSTLETACGSQPAILNISLLYQCRALTLPQPSSLRDERVKAVYVFVPFGRSLFGSSLSSISIPVLWEASNEDVLTPLPIEQIPAFQYLTTPNKYFALSQGLPHARINHEIISQITQNRSNWEDLKVIAERYHHALSLAFFKSYVSQDDRYRPFLSATYAAEISEDPYYLHLVQSMEIQAQD